MCNSRYPRSHRRGRARGSSGTRNNVNKTDPPRGPRHRTAGSSPRTFGRARAPTNHDRLRPTKPYDTAGAGTFGLSIRFGSIVHTPLGCRLLAAETSKSNHRGRAIAQSLAAHVHDHPTPPRARDLRETRLPGATDGTLYGEGRASPRSFPTHHVANTSPPPDGPSRRPPDAQTILNAASPRMLRVSYGVM